MNIYSNRSTKLSTYSFNLDMVFYFSPIYIFKRLFSQWSFSFSSFIDLVICSISSSIYLLLVFFFSSLFSRASRWISTFRYFTYCSFSTCCSNSDLRLFEYSFYCSYCFCSYFILRRCSVRSNSSFFNFDSWFSIVFFKFTIISATSASVLLHDFSPQYSRFENFLSICSICSCSFLICKFTL